MGYDDGRATSSAASGRLDGHSTTNGFHSGWSSCWASSICSEATGCGALRHAGALRRTLRPDGLMLCWKVRDTAPWLAAPFAALFFFNYRLAAIPLTGWNGAAGPWS